MLKNGVKLIRYEHRGGESARDNATGPHLHHDVCFDILGKVCIGVASTSFRECADEDAFEYDIVDARSGVLYMQFNYADEV